MGREALEHKLRASLFGNDTLLDLSGLTGPLTEVVQLRPADNAVANDLDPADAGAVVGESPLNANAVADSADCEALADTAALHLNHDTFEVLEPLAVAFNNLDEDANGVADLELGKICSKLLFFELTDDV